MLSTDPVTSSHSKLTVTTSPFSSLCPVSTHRNGALSLWNLSAQLGVCLTAATHTLFITHGAPFKRLTKHRGYSNFKAIS